MMSQNILASRNNLKKDLRVLSFVLRSYLYKSGKGVHRSFCAYLRGIASSMNSL